MRRSAAYSFLAGAMLMYFADPSRGKRRRAVTRDKIAAGWRDLAGEFDKAGRDLWNRTHGIACSVRNLWRRSDAGNPVVVQRVRARIGRAVSHPHAIRVRAEENGRIVLEGPVLRHEVDYLLNSVKAAPGVKEVASRLEIYTEPTGVSSLQGGGERRRLSEFAQDNWTPALRVASGTLSGAAIYAGLRRDGVLRWAGTLGGAALFTRAVVNRPFADIFGVRPGAARSSGAVHFNKTIHIDRPVEEVYTFWSNFENFPRFMTHLKEVRHVSDGRSHWVAAGPGGIAIPWDAEVTEQRANQLLAWRSVPGSFVRSRGVVRFDHDPDGGTRLTIRMSYCPPAGVFGHAVAWLFGADPKTEIDEDLVRLKSLLETGKTRAHGVAVTRDQMHMPQQG